MDIREIIGLLRKYKKLLIILPILAGSAVFFYATYILKPVYQTSSVMIIGSDKTSGVKSELTVNDYSLYIKLVNSYRVLGKTDRILDQVSKSIGKNISTQELSEKINIQSENETEIIKIIVEDNDPILSANIANAFANVFVSEVPKIMKLDNVQIIDNAKIPKKPKQNNMPIIVGSTILLVLFICMGIVFFIDYLDVTIKSQEQLEKILDVPTLGSIPILHTCKDGDAICAEK